MKHYVIVLSLFALISSSYCLFDAGDCGREKTCFVEEDFSRQFSFDQPATGDLLTIEMQAKNSKWVATSFSTDEFLGDDDVISCECEYDLETPDNCSRIIAKDLRLNGRSNYIANHIDASQSLCVLEAEYVNGEIYCKLEKFIAGLFVCLFVCLLVCLFVYMVIWLFGCLVIWLFVCLFVYSHILYLAADVDNTDEDLTNCLYQFYSSGDSNLKLDRQVLYEPSAPPLRSTSCVEVKLPIGPNIRIVQVSPEKYCFI